jgi:glycosyltransferase involved in cell wall biosynthesis
MPANDRDGARAARPYTIEIVPADRGWILEKIASEIAREAATRPADFRVSVTLHPSGRADLTFFLPESAWRDDLRDTIRVTYLAHKEEHAGAAALFEEVARKSDCCITSSSKYADVLRADGAREVFTIPLGVDTQRFVPKIRIGVVGRTYSTGRKGESLLARVMDLPFTEFVFTGEGWPLPAGHYGDDDLAAFYQSLDYLLVPSLIEGGPVPMLEALATGCKVIAPSDIGMVRDFPHLSFRRGDADDLRRVLEREIDERCRLRAAALPCDWRRFAARHLDLFASLIERAQCTARADRSVARNGGPRALLLTHGPETAAKGGPSTRVRGIVEHLRARGCDVEAGHGLAAIADRFDVVHVFNGWPPDSALATLVAAKRAGAKVVFSPIALDLSDWPLFHPFLERFFATSPAPDALRATLASIRAATPSRRYGAGGATPVEPFPGLFEKLRQCCELADRVVLLSQFERSYLEAIGARVDRAEIVHNGVDVERMADGDPDRFRRAHGLGRYLLCVGRLEYRKNQALAALAARTAGATLVCVGAPGDAGYVDHVRTLGGRHVRIVDRVEDRAMLASAYAGADALLFPSWTEGAPLAVMEAGAVGTPLVVGELSSERELFGDFARYVHPADVDGLAAAVSSLVVSPEPCEAREARARRFRTDFSIAAHAERTWATYAAVHATKAASRPIVADVSALLHFTRMREPFTGVPLVEQSVLRELAAMEPALRTVAYNDVKGRFIEIARSDLEQFDPARFDAQYWFSNDVPHEVDRQAELRFADGEIAAVPYIDDEAEAPQPRLRTRAAVLGKRALQRAPRVVREPAIALLQGVRPGFDPWRLPEEYLAFRARAVPDVKPRVPRPEEPGEVRFSHALATLLTRDAARRREVVPAGARLLTLGQSWLSNPPLLGELVRLVETRAVALEPYVYDLSYHTGAQHSGFADNEERFGRLLTLLRHSRTVFTESRQVEDELQKLAASRGLRFRTVRTGLRGRTPATDADSPGTSAYPPGTFVLYVSSFNGRKNHDFLIGVWRDLFETWIEPNQLPFRLVLVGQVQEAKRFADAAFLAQLAQKHVDVLSDVPDASLAALMRDCAFTVYPSLQEGWGLPAQESLMAGKVCVVSNTLPVAEEISNPALVRLGPRDFYGWREALKTWLSNPAMRAAFEARAREYVPPTWREISEAIVTASSTTCLEEVRDEEATR